MLTGERVTLRPVRPDDWPTLYEWRLDLDTWFATTPDPPYAVTYEHFLHRIEERAHDETNADFAAEAGGELIGRGSLFAIDSLARNAEVGIQFGPRYRGQGYGREALRLLCDFAFRYRNLHRLWLETLASNAAALRCYAAVGFVEEGRLREQAWVTGTYDDVVRMGLLAREWRG